MRPRRQMAAVMFTDLVGFTSLAHADETKALGVVEATHRAVQPIVREHHGRTVKSTGDGLLLEFPSARGAILCALQMQTLLRSDRASSAAGALAMRIGVHSGDVERRGDDILGDTVNIAARLEGLAPPGGLCISRTVLDQVRSSVPMDARPVRGRSIKGLGRSVEAYRVMPALGRGRAPPTESNFPRLAVLPLSNISPSPADSYIAEGLTEELIAMLSQVDGLRVIARTSVMHYLSDPKPIAEVARELNVESVLEGSVRRAADDLRVTLQLIDGSSEEHVWSRTYDRRIQDVLQFQREIAADISSQFRAKAPPVQLASGARATSPTPDSHLAYLRGKAALRQNTPETAALAARNFARAIRLDRRNARAYCGLADAHIQGWYYRVIHGKTRLRDNWTALIEQALKLDPQLSEAHVSMAGVLDTFHRNGPAAEAEYRRALRIDPGCAEARLGLGHVLEFLGRADEAEKQFRLAYELDPLSLDIAMARGENAIWLGNYRLAETYIQRVATLEGRLGFRDFGSSWLEAVLAGILGDERRLERLYRKGLRRARTPAQKVESAIWRAAHQGDARRLQRLLPKAKELLAPERICVNLAGAYASLGMMDEAFFWLYETLKAPGLSLAYWRYNPRHRDLRRDPRWPGFLREAVRPTRGI